MSLSPNLINSQRLRKLPSFFSWIDPKLIHHAHLAKISAEAAVLYLFLLGVADREGMSYYSDGKIREKTVISDLDRARKELIQADLVAYRKPFYQLLSLPQVFEVSKAHTIKPLSPISEREEFEINRLILEFKEGF
jgi:hypothetical protein